MEAGYAAAEDPPYLPLPFLQAEDPDPQGKGKDRDQVPQVQQYLYQKELTLFRGCNSPAWPGCYKDGRMPCLDIS